MIDVATRLADWIDQPPERWGSAVNRFVPRSVTGVLVVTLAYQFAVLTWTLGADATPVAFLPSRAVIPSQVASASAYSVLIDSHLFGLAVEPPGALVASVVDAPDTTLSLTLTGILSKDGDRRGSAVIKNSRNEEKAYYVDQAIDGADGATLHSVYADRVLLNRSGRLETLRLPQEESASTASALATPSALPQAPRSAPLREVISRNAARLSDVLRAPSPHVQEGRVVGFRLTPGRDRATFEALGLQPNDVVTEINGMALDDVGKGLQVFQALGESTQANVTVLRDGVPRVLVIDTTQLQGQGENRE